MQSFHNYKPTRFFIISIFISCAMWLLASIVSWQASLQSLLFPLILLGMSGPTISAFIMLAQSRDLRLWTDFWQRFRFDKLKLKFLPVILLLMPFLVILAIAISESLGLSSQQLMLALNTSDKALAGINILAVIFIVILSCTLEEVGWRGYGIDSLDSRFNLLQTSFIFAAVWAFWHVPAFFIKDGYFQQEIWNLGLLYVITYFLSLFPITILINWLYKKNNRSILSAIMFHSAMNISYGFFSIQPITRIIILALLVITAVWVIIKNKRLFFDSTK